MNSVEDFKLNPEKELENIYKHSKSKYLAYISRKFSIPSNQALDIFQQALVILWQNNEEGKLKSGSIDPYLTVIIRNLSLAQTREIKKERNLTNKVVAHEIIRNIYNNDLNYDDKRIDLIKKGLNELGDPCRQLLKMAFYENKTTEDIIETMGYKNADTVKTKKYKCLKRLRSLINDISNRK